ncbi:hypothetical protein HDZ31DRAFT_70375 [Schizophyllum fasciatum]
MSTGASEPELDRSQHRRSLTQRRRRAINIDMAELSDHETDESDSPSMADVSDTSGVEDGDPGEDEGGREEIKGTGIPAKDGKGRPLSTFLVARLKRLPDNERVRLIKSFDRISDYEFEREENIAKREALMLELGLQDDVNNLFAERQRISTSPKRKRSVTRATDDTAASTTVLRQQIVKYATSSISRYRQRCRNRGGKKSPRAAGDS